MCADYSTGLNDALCDVCHPIPDMESIMASFSGNRVFTQLDLSDAYLQLVLNPSCRNLTTINTHRGLFQYNRLVFGLKTAPAIFQRAMDQTLAGLDGVLVYLDDILVMGSSQTEHDGRLLKVLSRLQEWGFRLGLAKCHFNAPSVKYLGVIVDKDGIRADPQKIQAIRNLRRPENISEVRSLLGLINYYGRFVDRLHRYKAVFEALLRKDTKFLWSPAHDQAFEKVKDVLSGPLVLAHYDPRQKLIVAADACETGIGGVLLQRYADSSTKAVFHISKSLNPAQRNYSQIEKEALALITTVERLRKFIWGRRFVLQTDHRPLLALFRTSQTKGLSDRTAARLRRWALRLVGYDFDIEYIRTADFGHADALSRLIQQARKDAADPEMDEVIANVNAQELEILSLTSDARFFTHTGEKIREATRKDPLLQQVSQRLLQGWNKSDSKDPNLRPFAQQADSLCDVEGTLLVDERVVVPSSLRTTVLKQLHQGHPGIVRMKALGRMYFYWPGMSVEIERLVRSCPHCAQNASSPVKVPLAPWPDPEKAWVRVHLDFAEPRKGKAFLVIVDAFSKFVDATWMSPASSFEVVKYLKTLFRLMGPPETMVTDNGCQFTSREFASLCQSFNIVHLRCAPRMPQSNGQAERMVHTLKNSLQDQDPEALDRAVAAYNYTPCQTLGGKAPSEVFFGRRVRTHFSVFRSGSSNLPAASAKFKHQFDDHHGTCARQFSEGEEVVIELHNGRRVPAIFTEYLGSSMAKLKVDDADHVRHLNQIWRRKIDSRKALGEEVLQEHFIEELLTNASDRRQDCSPVATESSSQSVAESSLSPVSSTEFAGPSDEGESSASQEPSEDTSDGRRKQPARAAKDRVLSGFSRFFGAST
ncbi:uncharacterized protein K02A2.6-like [Galendromus occidentalis]|uniref:RNA-directed DNA polymerase n=1 Tax=Galendromus occidentalis TaxID=34638 RepID=A0AAJ6VVQ4_9ACAR|nr:uncharacterized protein K02A2.6-like [Galendromus occidentalis]